MANATQAGAAKHSTNIAKRNILSEGPERVLQLCYAGITRLYNLQERKT